MGMNSTEDKIKEIAREFSKATEPVIKEAKKAAEPFIRDVKEATKFFDKDIDVRLKDIKDKAEPVYSEVKTKAEPYIKDIKEKAGAKAAKFTCKEEVFVQYSHHEIKTSDIIERAKKDYISKGNKATSIKEIQVYIKPSDNAAYYVVNHTDTGKVEF